MDFNRNFTGLYFWALIVLLLGVTVSCSDDDEEFVDSPSAPIYFSQMSALLPKNSSYTIPTTREFVSRQSVWAVMEAAASASISTDNIIRSSMT